MLWPFILLINASLLLITLVIAYRIYRASIVFNKNPGDGEIQGPLKWRMLRGIIYLILLAVSAVIFNLVIGSWFTE